MAIQENTETPKGPTAPYVSFLTVKNIVKDMKEHSIPGRIDRSVWPNLAGGTVGQLLPALKFLRLMDESGIPLAAMRKLVAAHGAESWAAALSEVVRAAYAPLFQINLETASPKQFVELFRQNYPGTEEVSRKSQTFFLSAAREAGIKISTYIMKNKKPRSTPAKKRAKGEKANDQNPSQNNGATTPNNNNNVDQHNRAKPMEYQLLDLMHGSMSETEKSAVWTLINYLKAPKGA